ncbi:MAG TPA: hypothetical protein VHE08_04075 [Solirubrobacterales bacterium]|nr:hypothetical protein [Solirubrobacterales bacterium]
MGLTYREQGEDEGLIRGEESGGKRRFALTGRSHRLWTRLTTRAA